MGLKNFSILILLILLVATNVIADDTLPQWQVEEGDRFHFRIQIGYWPRDVELSERTMAEEEIVYIEISELQEITNTSSWVPTFDYSMCRSQMYLQDGSDLPDSGLFVHISSGIWNFPHMGAMPIGDWNTASNLVLEKNDGLPNNASYEIVEDSTSWGYIYNYPDLNMTSTERWSKSDGSLLSVNLVNGISERMYPNESLDVNLERYDSGSINLVIIIVVTGVGIVIVAVVLFTRRSR
ncbi:MAG: hypothetical protein ACFFE6_11375 [Candidatus Thorarchaeota archaeon]